MPGFDNFKIINNSQIVVVDSLKSDIIDDGNHTLYNEAFESKNR